MTMMPRMLVGKDSVNDSDDDDDDGGSDNDDDDVYYDADSGCYDVLFETILMWNSISVFVVVVVVLFLNFFPLDSSYEAYETVVFNGTQRRNYRLVYSSNNVQMSSNNINTLVYNSKECKQQVCKTRICRDNLLQIYRMRWLSGIYDIRT